MASNRKWGPHFLARALRLWDKGLSAAAIAEAVGLGREGKNIIIGIAHRNAFPARPSPVASFIPISAQERERRLKKREQLAARRAYLATCNEKARALCRRGFNTIEIGAALDISQVHASKLVRDINPRRQNRGGRTPSHIGAAP